MTKEEKAACLDVLQNIPADPECEDMAHMIECAVLHSNIPPCCVAHFIYGHGKLTQEQQQTYDDMEDSHFPGHYSPCPSCFAKYLKTGSFRKTRRCDCECQCCGCERERSPEGVCRHGETA